GAVPAVTMTNAINDVVFLTDFTRKPPAAIEYIASGCMKASDADVFIPEPGVRVDEFLHQPNAFRVIEYINLDGVGAQIIFSAGEVRIFADNDAGNFVQNDGPAAHRAW